MEDCIGPREGRGAAHLFSPFEGSPYSVSGSCSTGFRRVRRPDGALPSFLCIEAVFLGVAFGRAWLGSGDEFTCIRSWLLLTAP
jgi:hypothetical protein